MKIIATLKSLNEEMNIANAIESYHDWVDEILLADGGSTDRTVEIALSYPKVKVLPFKRFYKRPNGSMRNHEGHHLNFLFRWAEERNGDWIIHDDCDCVLNSFLKKDARTIFESTQEETIHAVRLYVYKNDKHFLRMSYINNEWQPGLWAWRSWTRIKCKNVIRHFQVDISHLSKRILLPPYCILHKFAQTDEITDRKVADYKVEAPTAVHPKTTYGEPVDLPEWAV